MRSVTVVQRTTPSFRRGVVLVEPAATATIVGVLDVSPVVWRWVRQAALVGAEIRRPRRSAPVGSVGARRSFRSASVVSTTGPIRPGLLGAQVDVHSCDSVDGEVGPASDDVALVVMASRSHTPDSDGGIAGLSGDEFLILVSSGEELPLSAPPAISDMPDLNEQGRGWVALVGMAGRMQVGGFLNPSGREPAAHRDDAAIRRSAGSTPRTGCAPVPASARTDRGLSARPIVARTGPLAPVIGTISAHGSRRIRKPVR
jgi:hypothetical protein